jgi:phosphoribosyl-ATP pyrophosphohydrolase/phosphoribosyl-AMP cyclohydrolase
MGRTAVDLGFDDQGLLVAVAQDHLTGQIRMVAFMNRAAVEATLNTGKATFYSRSRACLWTKGETSGYTLLVKGLFVDCDADALVLQVEPLGPSCHTGRPTCFFRQLQADGSIADVPCLPGAFLDKLEAVLLNRQQSTSGQSYTKALLDAGAPKIGRKLTEEANELAHAIEHETAARVASEAADVIYHLMVGLRHRGVSVRHVLAELELRSQLSGHEEKARRKLS